MTHTLHCATALRPRLILAAMTVDATDPATQFPFLLRFTIPTRERLPSDFNNSTVVNTDHTCSLPDGGLGYMGSGTGDVAAALLAAVLAHEATHYDDEYPLPAAGPPGQPNPCAKKASLEEEASAAETEVHVLDAVLDCEPCITITPDEFEEIDARRRQMAAHGRRCDAAAAATDC